MEQVWNVEVNSVVNSSGVRPQPKARKLNIDSNYQDNAYGYSQNDKVSINFPNGFKVGTHSKSLQASYQEYSSSPVSYSGSPYLHKVTKNLPSSSFIISPDNMESSNNIGQSVLYKPMNNFQNSNPAMDISCLYPVVAGVNICNVGNLNKSAMSYNFKTRNKVEMLNKCDEFKRMNLINNHIMSPDLNPTLIPNHNKYKSRSNIGYAINHGIGNRHDNFGQNRFILNDNNQFGTIILSNEQNEVDAPLSACSSKLITPLCNSKHTVESNTSNQSRLSYQNYSQDQELQSIREKEVSIECKGFIRDDCNTLNQNRNIYQFEKNHYISEIKHPPQQFNSVDEETSLTMLRNSNIYNSLKYECPLYCNIEDLGELQQNNVDAEVLRMELEDEWCDDLSDEEIVSSEFESKKCNPCTFLDDDFAIINHPIPIKTYSCLSLIGQPENRGGIYPWRYTDISTDDIDCSIPDLPKIKGNYVMEEELDQFERQSPSIFEDIRMQPFSSFSSKFSLLKFSFPLEDSKSLTVESCLRYTGSNILNKKNEFKLVVDSPVYQCGKLMPESLVDDLPYIHHSNISSVHGVGQMNYPYHNNLETQKCDSFKLDVNVDGYILPYKNYNENNTIISIPTRDNVFNDSKQNENVEASDFNTDRIDEECGLGGLCKREKDTSSLDECSDSDVDIHDKNEASRIQAVNTYYGNTMPSFIHGEQNETIIEGHYLKTEIFKNSQEYSDESNLIIPDANLTIINQEASKYLPNSIIPTDVSSQLPIEKEHEENIYSDRILLDYSNYGGSVSSVKTNNGLKLKCETEYSGKKIISSLDDVHSDEFSGYPEKNLSPQLDSCTVQESIPQEHSREDKVVDRSKFHDNDLIDETLEIGVSDVEMVICKSEFVSRSSSPLDVATSLDTELGDDNVSNIDNSFDSCVLDNISESFNELEMVVCETRDSSRISSSNISEENLNEELTINVNTIDLEGSLECVAEDINTQQNSSSINSINTDANSENNLVSEPVIMVKRKPGRPRKHFGAILKNPIPVQEIKSGEIFQMNTSTSAIDEVPKKRGRGRPRKIKCIDSQQTNTESLTENDSPRIYIKTKKELNSESIACNIGKRKRKQIAFDSDDGSENEFYTDCRRESPCYKKRKSKFVDFELEEVKEELALNGKFTCKKCKKVYKSMLGYQTHLKQCDKLSTLSFIECSLCSKSIRDTNYERHLRRHEWLKQKRTENGNRINLKKKDDKSGPLSCIKEKIPIEAINSYKEVLRDCGIAYCKAPNCGFFFNRIVEGKVHLRKCLYSRRYGCNTCEFYAFNFDDAKIHLFKCHKIDLNFDTVDDYLASLKEVGPIYSSSDCVRPYQHALRWTKYFRKSNFSMHLNNDWICSLLSWKQELTDQESLPYLPLCSSSPKFKCSSSNTDGDLPSWDCIGRFQGTKLEAGGIFFVGGSIRASAWCPIPDSRHDSNQILALSTFSDMEENIPIKGSIKRKGLIQFWECSIEKNALNAPGFTLGLAHDYGICWSMEWCPSGIYEGLDLEASGKNLTRLGALAGTFSNGTIEIFIIPHPSQLSRKLSKIYYKSSDISLCPFQFQTLGIQCLKLSWFTGKGHSYVAGGFSNGMVCIWDFKCANILRSQTNNKNIIYPIKSFPAHHSSCAAVSFCPSTDGKHLVTGGYDRTIKFWDLSSPDNPLSIIRKGMISDSVWLPHWAGSFVSFDDVFTLQKNATSFRENGFYGGSHRSAITSNAIVWAISGSDWFNAIAQVDDAGEVLISLMQNLTCESTNEKQLSKKRFPLFVIKLESHITGQFLDLKKEYSAMDNDSADNENESKSKSFFEPIESPKFIKRPQTYSSVLNEFGVHFIDQDYVKSGKIESLLDTKKTSETMEPGPLNIFPLMSATSVSWNNNYDCRHLVFVGLHCGFGRIVNLSFLDKM